MSWRDPILFFSSKSIKKNCKKTKNKNEKNVLLERKKLWSDPRQTRCWEASLSPLKSPWLLQINKRVHLSLPFLWINYRVHLYHSPLQIDYRVHISLSLSLSLTHTPIIRKENHQKRKKSYCRINAQQFQHILTYA